VFVRKFLRLLFLALLPSLAIASGFSPAHASTEPFPVYDSIEANVAFWRDIYGKYSNAQGVVHDSRDLAIVYEVIDLEGVWETEARRRDQARIEAVKAKYAELLESLANSGACPQTREEKRVAALFGENATVENFRAAKDRLRVQSGQSNMFRQGVIRSGSYLAEIKRIMASHGLPEDLAYLPHVESSFNYQAYSKFGAAGIWQFMYETGKEYMTVDYAIDERRDPLRSTHAAAKLLKSNYERLGSWPLAITAYNHGPNGMMRAKEAHGTYENILRDYESKTFKFASRNFYPEFLAAREVAKNYKKYFGSLRIDAPVNSRSVSLPKFAHVNDLVKHLKVDMATFKALNPALREPIYSGQKLVPKGYAVRVPQQGKVLEMAADIPEAILEESQKKSSIYMVRNGDTASSVARQHGVSVQDLARANQLDGRATVFVGQSLRIPKSDVRVIQLAAEIKEKAAQQEAAARAKNVPELVPNAAKLRIASEPQASSTPEHENASGKISTPETVARVSPAAEIPAAAAGKKNAESQQVEAASAAAPQKQAKTSVRVMGDFSVNEVVKKKGQVYGIIRVEAEENIGRYAQWLGVRAWDIRHLNGFKYEQELKINQKLKIPLGKVGKERFEELRYEYHREMEEDFFAAYRVEGYREYRVKAGDNIWALCQNEFDLPLWLIKKYNADVDFNQLKLGQAIIVPQVGSIS